MKKAFNKLITKITNWLPWIVNVGIVRKPKKSITLQEFYDAVGEVAKEKNQDFYQVTIQMNKYEKLRLTGYIHNTSHLSGLTIDEVCKKLRNYVEPSKVSPIETVTVELEAA